MQLTDLFNFNPELSNQARLASTSMSESPSLANLQNKQNRDQQYLAVRCNPSSSAPRGSNSNDSGSFGKAEGNEYIEDICPYATFQLNKQTYSESSYSGNVYSGPYHSVRGSFVYHDVKPESYHVTGFYIFNFNNIIIEIFCSQRSRSTPRCGEKSAVSGILTRRAKVDMAWNHDHTFCLPTSIPYFPNNP